MASKPGDESDQRRLVNVTPGEVLAAGDVIEFVAEVPVMIDTCKLDEEFADGEKGEEEAGIAKRFRPSMICCNRTHCVRHRDTFPMHGDATSSRYRSTDGRRGDAVEFRKILVEIFLAEGGDRALVRRFAVAAVNFLHNVHA